MSGANPYPWMPILAKDLASVPPLITYGTGRASGASATSEPASSAKNHGGSGADAPAPTRAELDMRRRVEAARRPTRRSVRIVVGGSVGTAIGLAVFNHSYVEPYDDLLGQLVLCLVIALYAAGFLWLRRLARYEMPNRILTGARAERPGVPGEVPTTFAARQSRGAGGQGLLRGRHTMDAGGGGNQ